MQDFKQIKAYQRAHAMSIALQKLARGFTRAGHSHLRSQLTRAVESIASNIVEGCGAATYREFARYLDIAVKSATETEHHLRSAHDFGLISEEDFHKYTAETIEIRKMICGYRKKILIRAKREKP